MRRNYLSLCLLGPLFGSVGLSAQTSRAPDSKLQPLLAAIANAVTSAQSEDVYLRLLKDTDDKRLRVLKRHPDNGTAFQAAWKEVGLAGVRKGAAGAEKEVDQIAVARFLGFVEGRLGVQLPTWWEESVKHAVYTSDKTIRPGLHNSYHTVTLTPEQKVGGGIGVPKGTALAKHVDGVLLTVNSESMVLSRKFFEEFCRSPSLSALVNAESCYLALHTTLGNSFPLIHIDRRTGEKLWQTEVWDFRFDALATGPSWENVAVIASGDRVIVIGSGTFCFFIEGFEQKTGRNTFRFATRYFRS